LSSTHQSGQFGRRHTPGRCLLNDHANKWAGREIELLRNIEEEAPAYADARAAGNFDIAAVIAGESAGLIRQILPAGVIMQQMVEDAERRIALLASSVTLATRAQPSAA
jgi:nitronate monooxygenase